jgi:hypothetical protein
VILIDIQKNKIVQAMDIDKRGVFKRLSKLLEEQGEMYEAYLLTNTNETIEEAIDNLIVLVSLAYEIDKNSLISVEMIASQGIQKAIDNSILMVTDNPDRMLMSYSVCIGNIADMFQKYESVASSLYKGKVSAEDTLESVNKAILTLMTFIGQISTDTVFMNELIVKKTNKWIEKVS